MNFEYNEVIKKRRKMASKKSKRTSAVFTSLLKLVIFAILSVFIFTFFVGLGAIKGIIESAPDTSTLNVSPTSYSTTVYDNNGQVITTLLKTGSNRQEVSIDEIPECLQYAFIDIEDERFMYHNGIDLKGILRAAATAFSSGELSQGASTITQQLLKNNVFENGGRESSKGALIKRKFQEQYLALQLEKTTTKQYILQSYLNTINLGSNTLGVQSAAKRYFNKDAKDLNLSESAVIAAITQNPTKYNPVTNPEKNAERRLKVLKKMLKNSHITQAEYNEAVADDVYSRIQSINVETSTDSPYSYFVDAMIDQLLTDLMEQKGYTQTQAYNVIYSGGLSIYTTQDLTIQNICDQEVNNVANYPMSTKYSLSWAWTVQKADGTLQNYSEADVEYYHRVTLSNPSFKMIFTSQEIGDGVISAFKASVLQEGDTEIAENKEYTLQPQTSFTVMDQKTGYVKAIVGGRGEKTASLTLNRATDTTRQPGSCFKVLSTYAPALDTAGYTLASTIKDAPFYYDNGRPVKNWWGGSYRGNSTLRKGIYDSMNVVTVKLLTEITPELGFQYLLNFGFTTLVDSRTNADGSVVSDIAQPLALGGITDGVTNLELCAAYACIANNGQYIKPTLYTSVLDHNGKPIIEVNSSTKTVLKDSTAYLLTSAMEDVVKKGTGTACAVSGMSVAGKTGTTSDDNDLWFAGYTPYLTATIWTGYDENASLTDGAYHEKMWSKIVTQIDAAKGYTVDPGFTKPESVVSAKVCSSSGLLAGSGCPAIEEYFAEGTAPTGKCTSHYSKPATTETTTETPAATENTTEAAATETQAAQAPAETQAAAEAPAATEASAQ